MLEGIARVHLIGTHCIPSGNAAVVTAEVRGLVETGLPMVFEPSNALITEPGLYLEDSLVDPDPDGRVRLVIHNSTEDKVISIRNCKQLIILPWKMSLEKWGGEAMHWDWGQPTCKTANNLNK